MESRKGQRNQTARGNRADSCSKGTGSKACAATYRTCQLPGGVRLIKEDPWQTKVNLCLKPRYDRAAKWGLILDTYIFWSAFINFNYIQDHILSVKTRSLIFPLLPT